MKCISLWQPWAHLVAIGAKRIETRSWPTSHRGPIAIHAAKKWDGKLQAVLASEPFASTIDPLNIGVDLPLGCIVATANLWECWGVHRIKLADANQSPELDEKLARTLRHAGHSEDRIRESLKPLIRDDELAFGDFTDGRYGWLLRDVVKLPKPIPFRGAQGLFDVPDELLAQGVAA